MMTAIRKQWYKANLGVDHEHEGNSIRGLILAHRNYQRHIFTFLYFLCAKHLSVSRVLINDLYVDRN